jgi:hypothetical protein
VGGSDFGLARYNTDGTPDASFGSGGIVRTDFDSGQDIARSVAVLADGRIVEEGTHAELLRRSERYRTLLALEELAA